MTTTSPPLLVRRALLADGRLALEFESRLASWIDIWLPRIPSEVPSPDVAAAVIRVERGAELPGEVPDLPPLLTLGSVTLWLPAGGTRAVLRGARAGAGGVVDLLAGEARLIVSGEEDAESSDLYSMLTLSAALLLGRLERTPVHAAAVIAPNGKAFLLSGDARAGKSTTTVNLITAGWDYLSDDQIVLLREGADIGVEGWPRPFHLDEGWEEGVSTGRRRTIDSAGLGPGSLRRSAILGGSFFPVVCPDEPTHLVPISAAQAFAGLFRQTPWLLVDRGSADALLPLLTAAASRPAFRLVLGLDTYRDPARLVSCLAEAWRCTTH